MCYWLQGHRSSTLFMAAAASNGDDDNGGDSDGNLTASVLMVLGCAAGMLVVALGAWPWNGWRPWHGCRRHRRAPVGMGGAAGHAVTTQHQNVPGSRMEVETEAPEAAGGATAATPKLAGPGSPNTPNSKRNSKRTPRGRRSLYWAVRSGSFGGGDDIGDEGGDDAGYFPAAPGGVPGSDGGGDGASDDLVDFALCCANPDADYSGAGPALPISV